MNNENKDLKKLEKRESILSYIALVSSIVLVVYVNKYNLDECKNLMIATILGFITSVLATLIAICDIKLKRKPIEGMYGGWFSTILWAIGLFYYTCYGIIEIINRCWK